MTARCAATDPATKKLRGQSGLVVTPKRELPEDVEADAEGLAPTVGVRRLRPAIPVIPLHVDIGCSAGAYKFFRSGPEDMSSSIVVLYNLFSLINHCRTYPSYESKTTIM